MLRNYFNVALRNLLRNKSASIIKIISLSTGMICFAIIALFIYHEISFDRFHDKPEQVYRVVKDFVNDDGSRLPDATTPPAVAPHLQKDLPEVAFCTRVFPNWGRKYLIQYKENSLYEERLVRVDSSFFDVFTFPFVKGDKRTSTTNPNFILLTESAAQRYFGNEDPIGKALKLDLGPNGTDFFVTGILKDIPETAHFTFDFLISVRSFNYNQLDTDWNWYNFYTYVRLKDGVNPELFSSKIQPIFNKYNAQDSASSRFYTQPLTDIHLRSHLKWEMATNGDYNYIVILGTIALAVILLAAINYINLVTAQSARRSKEVGIRKVSGAIKGALVNQFLFESMILTTIATILSIAVAEAILPALQDVFNTSLSFFQPDHYRIIYAVLGVGVATGLLAGIYPAFVLSSFQPVKVLKGTLQGFAGDAFLRKGLVMFQFVISTVLIIGTFVISAQINYIRNKKLGFNKDNVMLVHNAYGIHNLEGLYNDIKAIPGVVNVGAADGVLGGQNWTTSTQAKGSENSLLLNFLSVDPDFLSVMSVKFTEGRNFSKDNKADSASIILNETAVKQLGIKENVIGSQIQWGSDQEGNPIYANVIGVIEDFHFSSFHEPIKAFGFQLSDNRLNKLFVKIEGDKISSTSEAIREAWSKYVPARPFEFSFQDEQIAKLYAGEVKFQKLFSNFTAVAIVIACLGLFGLSAYTAQLRTKEIGIRKALGATVLSVTQLLSKDFLRLVVVAVIISVPLAWYAMNEWLRNFAYRIELTASVFIVAAAAALLIAIVTVSFQAVKAAMANPVDSLRNE